MPNFNQSTLMGNVTRDPQLKQLPSGTSVAQWGMAVNEKYRTKAGEEREDVLFIDCETFGRGAEVIAQYVTKGKPLFVSGRLKYQSWDDKQGGGKRSKIFLAVDDFQLLGGGTGEGDGRRIDRSTDQTSQRQRPAQGQRPAPPQDDADSPAGDFDEGDIPFRWEGRQGGTV